MLLGHLLMDHFRRISISFSWKILNTLLLKILLQLKMGKSSKEIAFNMDLKENTVNSYREVMLRKTKTKNVAELITYAHQNGILG